MDEKQKLASDVRDAFDSLIYNNLVGIRGVSLVPNEDLKKFRDFLTALFPQQEAEPIGLVTGDNNPVVDKFM